MSSTGAEDMYIAYDLCIILLISRCTLLAGKHCYNTHFQHTLLTDVFHCSDQLILEKLTLLCDFFSFFQKVLGGILHRCRQNMSLFGSSFLLVRWAFVAGVYQGGDLCRKYKMVQQWNRSSGIRKRDVTFYRLRKCSCEGDFNKLRFWITYLGLCGYPT